MGNKRKIAGLAAVMLWTRGVQGSDVTRALPASSWQDPSGAGLKIRPLPGADAASLSLTDAVAYAIANNLDVEVARYAIRIAKTDVDRARGGGVVRSAGNHVS